MTSENFVDRREILPLLGEVKVSGEWTFAACPSHADGQHKGKAGWSLGLSKTGVLKCFAGCEFKDVIASLRKRDNRPSLAPIPIRSAVLPEHLVATYIYRNEAGDVIAEKGRFEGADGRKTFRWRLPGAEAWAGLDGMNMNDMPLFGVEQLCKRPDEPVYFVEGEKACEACQGQGMLTVTLGGGAGQKDFGHALDPLNGRAVYLWPDNDPPGRAFMTLLQARLQGLAKSVRLINVALPEKGDAFDFFRGGGKVIDIDSFSPTEPMVNILAEDAVSIAIPTMDGPVTLTFTEMEKTSRALDAELSISSAMIGDLPYTERINLDSASARTDLRRDLESQYGKELGWPKLLNLAWGLARQTFLRQDRGIAVEDIPDAIGDLMLIDPLVVADGPTIFFGDGSSLKSYLLFLMSLCMSMGTSFCEMTTPYMRVMVIDYEDSGGNFRRRLKRLSRGIEDNLDPMGVYYWPARGIPLREQVEAIKRKCDKDGITLLIIDSAAPACGGSPSDDVVALAFFRALKKIGLPCIVIAHITKGGDSQKPFGSVFWHNEARRTWYVHRVQEEDSDELDIGLFCRKVNDGQRPSPLGFHASFDGKDGPVRITRALLDRVPELLDQTDDRHRVWASLESGESTIAAISSETNLEYKRVETALRRGPFVQTGMSSASGRGRPAALWARRTEREEESTGRALFYD